MWQSAARARASPTWPGPPAQLDSAAAPRRPHTFYQHTHTYKNP